MEKKMTKSIQRIMAMLLCVAMLLPMAVVSVHAVDSESADGNAVELQQSESLVQDLTVEQEAELLAADTDGPLAVVYAASDFQPAKSGADDVDGGKTVMTSIVNQMWNAGYTSVNGALICGDYSNVGDTWNSSETNSVKYNDPGVDAVSTVLNNRWGLSSKLNKLDDLTSDNNYGDQVVYVQGNHDPADTKGLDSFGENDTDNYGVFVIHEDNFPWEQGDLEDSGNTLDPETVVKDTAAALRSYLQGKLDAKDKRPIFVCSHVPLHYGYRSSNEKEWDNVFAKYLFDVLNEFGSKLNIIFLFGHNHSNTYDDYLGGGAIYLPKGEDILIPKPNVVSNNTFSTETLNFTYMNAGYLGYYGGKCAVGLSSTIFEIYDDKVVVNRFAYDTVSKTSAVSNLKAAGVWDTNHTNNTSGFTAAKNNTDTYGSPQTIELKELAPDFKPGALNSGILLAEKSATLSVGGVIGKNYTVEWSSSVPSVATVAAVESNSMNAQVTAVGTGTTIITASVKEVTNTRAVGDTTVLSKEVRVTNEETVTLAAAGPYTYFVLDDNQDTSAWRADTSKRYVFVSQDKGNPTAGEFMAMYYNGQLDATEGDKIGTNDYGEAAQELNAEPITVMELPINGQNKYVVSTDDTCFMWKFKSQGSLYWVEAVYSPNSTTRALMLSKGHKDVAGYDLDDDGIRIRGTGSSASDSSNWGMSDSGVGLTAFCSNVNVTSTNLYYAPYYDSIQGDISVYYTQNGDEKMGQRIYVYKEESVTLDNPIIAYLSDKAGCVSVGVGTDAGTGDVIYIQNGDQVTQVPVTIGMLSGDNLNTADPGTYSGLTVTYAGKVITSNYTLEVQEAAMLLKNKGGKFRSTIYRQVEEMVGGRHYMIVDAAEAGEAHAMGATGNTNYSPVSAHNVLIQPFTINGEKGLYIDSTRYSDEPDNPIDSIIVDQGNVNANISSDDHKEAIRLVWTPTKLVTYPTSQSSAVKGFTTSSLTEPYYFLTSEYENGRLWVNDQNSSNPDEPVLFWGGSTSRYEEWKYVPTGTGQMEDGLSLRTTVTKNRLFYNIENYHSSSYLNKNFITEGDDTDYKPLRRRTWVYEQVDDIDAITARLDDKHGYINVNSNASVVTHDNILVETYKTDGTIEVSNVPVRVSMLSGDNLDITKVGTYTGLTLTYEGKVITNNYTLDVVEPKPNENPEMPNEGAVRIDKQLDTSRYVYLETGVASIDLSVTGIPSQSGVDIIFVLDTSSSMSRCIHHVAIGNTCTSCGVKITEENTRLALLKQTMTDTLEKLQAPVKGYAPDIEVAVACFNGYTPIDSDQFFYQEGYDKDTQAQFSRNHLDSSKVSLEFTPVSELTSEEITAAADNLYRTGGTNYDRGIEIAYKMLKAKQEQNALNGEDREQLLVFMSDGIPYQFNYIHGDHHYGTNPNSTDSNSPGYWDYYLRGTMDLVPGFASNPVYSDSNNLYNAFYNPDGRHWLTEAIKGDPSQKYRIINPDLQNSHDKIEYVNGLGATVYTIGMGVQSEDHVSAESANYVLTHMASEKPEDADVPEGAAGSEGAAGPEGDTYFWNCTSNDQFTNAFTTITDSVRSAGDAVFTDQMGPEFDLVTANMKTIINDEGEEEIIDLSSNPPTITVKSYPLFKRSEIGTMVTDNGKTFELKEEMVGKRKSVEPTVLETVTFNDDGTEAYSSVKGASVNILNGTIIAADKFWYNTDTENAHEITVNEEGETVSLAPETFYWNVGDIPQDELVLSYSVYLTGSMEGKRPKGVYDTNTHAELNYINYLEHPWELTVPSPRLPWNAATVGYGFYLVNKEGKPIINQTTGAIGSFKRAVKVTDPVYADFLLNSAGGTIIATEVTASAVLPEGYVLFDPDAKYNVNMDANGVGSYGVTKGQGKVDTTYIEGIEAEPFTTVGTVTTSNYATANTVVWFAVQANVQCVPDTVVIDYGLPVHIDVLKNDTMMGDHSSLTAIQYASSFDNHSGFVSSKKLWENLSGIPVGPENPALFTNTKLSGQYGVAEVLKDKEGKEGKTTGKISYTLNTTNGMQMAKEETFVYAVDYKGYIGTQGYYYSTVTVIPATTIYYEDNFVTYAIKDYISGTDKTDKNWEIAGNVKDAAATQDPDRPGQFSLEELDADSIYGSDSHYQNFATYSNGSARYCHVWSNVDDRGKVTKGEYGTATFTFTGTGFDIVSVTSNTTGTIVVQVTGQSVEGQAYSKNFVVDTYYGYKREFYKVIYTYVDGKWIIAKESDEVKIDEKQMGTPKEAPETAVEGATYTTYETRWVVDPAAKDALYQIPVMKVTDIPYGTYTVTITAAHRALFDHGQYDGTKYDFYLDAIRIYDPANDGAGNQVIQDAYVADKEGWPSYQELRNLIIAAKTFNSLKDDTVSGIVFIDGNENLSDNNASNAEGSVSGKLKNPSPAIKDYANYGPNNELYLAPGQGVAFKMNAVANAAAIHIAMKSIDGKAAKVKIYDATVNAAQVQTKEINTATDLYYDYTDLNGKNVVIYNAGAEGDGVLSITNIKTTHTSNPNGKGGVVFMVSKSVAAAALNSLAPVEVEAPEDTIPDATEPEVTEPEATEPETTEPEVTEPEVTEPEVTEPEVTEPEVTEPEVTEPEATEPEVTEPEATEPDEPEEFEPKKFNVKVSNSKVKVGSKVMVTVTTSADVDYIEINGTKVTSFTSSRRGQERTWKVKVTAEEAGEMNINVVCFNAAGTASQAITKTVTVNEAKPIASNQIMDLIGKLLGRFLGGKR